MAARSRNVVFLQVVVAEGELGVGAEPKATDGAMPKRRAPAASRADMPLRLPIRLRRNAEFSTPSMGRSISEVIERPIGADRPVPP